MQREHVYLKKRKLLDSQTQLYTRQHANFSKSYLWARGVVTYCIGGWGALVSWKWRCRFTGLCKFPLSNTTPHWRRGPRATQRLDEGLWYHPTKIQRGGQTFINEFGLYSLILGSRKPQAKIMQRWVTHEVLPNIRQSAQDTKSTQSTNSETQSTTSNTQNTKSPDIDTYLKRKRAELEVAEIDERIQSCKRRCFEESVFALQRCGLHMTDAERMISKDRIREIAFGPRFDVNNLSDSDDEQWFQDLGRLPDSLLLKHNYRLQ